MIKNIIELKIKCIPTKHLIFKLKMQTFCNSLPDISILGCNVRKSIADNFWTFEINILIIN